MDISTFFISYVFSIYIKISPLKKYKKEYYLRKRIKLSTRKRVFKVFNDKYFYIQHINISRHNLFFFL